MKTKGKTIIKVRTPEKTKEKRYAFDLGQKNIHTELICKFCSAVYEDKHWRPVTQLKPEYIDRLQPSVCPACHARKGMVSDGIVHIGGSFMNQHRQEILNIILKTEERENNRDVLNRIERIDTRPNELIVYTAKNMLATEIGKKIAEAYKGGKLEIKWSKKDKPVEVKWFKEIEKPVKITGKKIINKPKKK